MTEASKDRRWARKSRKVPMEDLDGIRKSAPPRVITTGISCRMGVGGRRGRKRRRSEERREPGHWIPYTPGRYEPGVAERIMRAFAGMGEAAKRAGESLFSLAASAPTAAPRRARRASTIRGGDDCPGNRLAARPI